MEAIDYKTTMRPVWCPGCGNFGVLTALTKKALPDLGIPADKIFIASGIGCSSRLPGYVNTYGFNTVHGRAVTVAQGAKLARPELTVLAWGGDGDFFSIGAGHLPHLVRRNPDITCIMINNFIYALTRGQVSPTTPQETQGFSMMQSQIYPPVNPILYMLSYSMSSQASFIAQGIATDPNHLAWLIEEGIKHKGFSFISVLTPCAIFNPPELFNTVKTKAHYLKEGETIELPASSKDRPWKHDSSQIRLALRLAQSPVLEKPHLGIFFQGKGKPKTEHIHLTESTGWMPGDLAE